MLGHIFLDLATKQALWVYLFMVSVMSYHACSVPGLPSATLLLISLLVLFWVLPFSATVDARHWFLDVLKKLHDAFPLHTKTHCVATPSENRDNCLLIFFLTQHM